MNKEIKEIFEFYEKQITNPDLSILVKTLKEWYFEKENYKSRIVKAIEYIDEYCIDDEFYINLTNKEKNIIKVKNILTGDDKDETNS